MTFYKYNKVLFEMNEAEFYKKLYKINKPEKTDQVL